MNGAMETMEADARRERCKAERRRQQARWAFTPHGSARQIESGAVARAASEATKVCVMEHAERANKGCS